MRNQHVTSNCNLRRPQLNSVIHLQAQLHEIIKPVTDIKRNKKFSDQEIHLHAKIKGSSNSTPLKKETTPTPSTCATITNKVNSVAGIYT